MGFVVYYSYNFLLMTMGSGSMAMLSALLMAVAEGVVPYLVCLIVLKVEEVKAMIVMVIDRKKSV